MTDINATAFEKEAIEASNLYTTALSIKDKASPDSLSKVVGSQHKDLEKDKKHLEKELKQLKQKMSAFDRDFLDQRQEKGEVVSTNDTAISLQDGVLSIFIFSWVLFCVFLIAFGFMPPHGNTEKGVTITIGLAISSFSIWGLIFNYA